MHLWSPWAGASNLVVNQPTAGPGHYVEVFLVSKRLLYFTSVKFNKCAGFLAYLSENAPAEIETR